MTKLSRSQKSLYDYILNGSGYNHWAYYTSRWHFMNDDEHNAWCAYLFAKDHKSRSGFSLSKLQSIVIKTGDAKCIYRWARDIEGANIRRCQEAIIKTGDVHYIRTFAMNIEGADKTHLEGVATINEVMGL